ncbi:SCO family protein [Haliangium sp.]|uniref:SCO family protein n=1 Tax=Haliangium sp. TaxID=2663208 RepID=UPI003D121BDB
MRPSRQQPGARRGLALSALAFALALLLPGAALWAAPERAGETTRSASKLVPNVGEGDTVGKLPKALEGLEVVEAVGAEVPRQLTFRDDHDQPVVLGSYFDGELPVLLTFNYTNCPMLCSVQLDTLVQTLKKSDKLVAGQQYQIITVSVDPTETPEVAAETKERYVARFPEQQRDSVRAGWHFLTGDKATIDALADVVGFRYRYVERTGEYAHTATLIFLSPWGTVTRYFHGIGYVPEQIDTSIFQAGAGEHGVSLGFLLACFRHDPNAGSHAKTGESTMRYGALGFLVLFLGGFGAWQYTRSRRGRRAESWAQAIESRQEGNDA